MSIGVWDDAASVFGRGSVISVLKGLGVAVGGSAIVPADENDLPSLTRGLYVGGAGDIRLVLANGDLVTLVAVPAGTLLPIAVRRVLATATTATNLVGLV